MKFRVLIALVTIVTGCTITGESVREEGPDVLYTVGARAAVGKRLIPFTTLDGYLGASGGGSGSTVRLLTGVKATKPIAQQPVAIGAGEGGVYIVDGLTNVVSRFRWRDPEEKQTNAVAENKGLSRAENVRLGRLSGLEDPTDLFVAINGDVFIADGKGKKLSRFDADGVHQQDYSDENNLNSPVAATSDSRGMRILVADSFFDRIIVFSAKGMPLYGIGERGEGPGKFRNIRAMTQGRDGLLYIVSGMKPDIQLYGLDGTYVGSFGRGVVGDPGGLAVDEENRLFVSDRFQHRLYVFVNRKLVETYGKYGKNPGEFSQPGRIAYHRGYLYVADRQNSRIQVFRVIPEKLIEEMKNKDKDSAK
ncbi:MAG: 6-bladed beta-propeller [Alphaproteobacteria bacterium]